MRLQYVEAGEIVSTHGVRGEFKVLPWTEGPEFLCEFDEVVLDGKKYEVESCRIQKTCDLLKLRGVDTCEDGQALRGKTVLVDRSLVSMDIIFAAELFGVEVFCDGEKIGKLCDVLDYPGNKVYVVKGSREYMIPAVKEFILNTDIEANRMDVKLLEGMEVDAD